MTVLDHVKLLLGFEKWANRRTLASIEDAHEPGGSVRWMAHILAAQRVWLTRLDGRDSNRLPIWPDALLSDCRETLEELEGVIDGYLAGLTEQKLETPVDYRNQTGASFSHTPLEMLTHLAFHAQHHRGQIAYELRRLGQTPAVTDFIAFRREK